MRPILFSIGPFSVHSWGVMFTLGIIAAVLVGRWHLKDRFVDLNAVYGIVLAAVVGGVIGARLFYVIGNWSRFAGRPLDLLKIWDLQGLVFYGGLLGGTLAALLVIRLKGLPFWTFADMAGLALPLGMAITRIGCFLNGDSFGKPTSMPWGVTFPEQTRISMGITGMRVHPTQLYELILDLALFVLLLIYRRRERWEGSIFLLFLIGYSMIRFSMEFFRAHNSAAAGPAFQLMSGAILLAALLVFVLRRRLMPELRMTVLEEGI